MNRALFTGSLLCVIFLLVGTFAFPASMVMQLASMSIAATIFRVIMALVLVAVLFTSPPRRRAVRIGMGAMATLLILSGLAMSLGNSMHMLDILLYLALGCALGLEALEFNDDELDARTQRYLAAYHALAKTAS